MSDALTFAEIEGQHVELLPVRTVLSSTGFDLSGGDATATSGNVDTHVSLYKGLVFVFPDSGAADADGGQGALGDTHGDTDGDTGK